MVSLIGERDEQKHNYGSQKCLGSTNLTQYVHEVVSLSVVLTLLPGQQEIVILNKVGVVLVERILNTPFHDIQTLWELDYFDLFFWFDKAKGTVFEFYDRLL